MLARLGIDESKNYGRKPSWQATILGSFRTMKRTGSMNYANHLTNIETFCRFVEASGITDFDALFDQMLVEEFLTSLPSNVRSFVRSKEPKNSQQCARYADLCYKVDRLNSVNDCSSAEYFVQWAS